MERYKGIFTPEQIAAERLGQEVRAEFIQLCCEVMGETPRIKPTDDEPEQAEPQAIY